MSLALSSLRSHFSKHLALYNRAASFFSFDRRIHRHPAPSPFSVFLQQQQSRLFTAAVNYSTLPFNNGATYNSFTAPYLSVHICCPKHLSDALSESLMCFGANSTTIDEQDVRNSDEEIWIGSTFDVDEDVKECISRAANSVGLKEIPNYKVEKQEDHTDWIKQSQESFHPVEITEGVWIVPEWREPPDLQATNIMLNPGLAFGTGEHPTTKLCLLLLHRLIKGGEYFLDYGTGSGVLAIAALKFGADLSVGFDIEPQAIASARHNASLNNVGPEKLLLSLVPSENRNESPLDHMSAEDSYNLKLIAEKNKYDVVVANILLYPLLELADRIVSYAKPGATVGISGIISEQIPVVMERYSQLLEDINISMMDDWACISGSKKA
ncbi:ribosomal protein L11 methyltransferase-like protein [Perilla frutescens var. hirtella]|uniref:ETFB lysine methyltransferase n=1 Tax=Perilla frutescens var. hirtella TaxID=608512 RepID=A0AAD4JK73_PERFH|nr:ribosomal protein L11 methyltransferase-like protein [Perilla frutescens var. hirtella]